MPVVLECQVYMLKNVGGRTAPCGTPFFNLCCVYVFPLNALRLLMWLSMNLIMVCEMFVWCSLCVNADCVEYSAHV